MARFWVGIDNGVSGTIGIICDDGRTWFFPVPVKSEQNYTKEKGNITRINITQLTSKLVEIVTANDGFTNSVMVQIERPMVNPTRFKATTSALRALEAVLNVIEILGYSYEYVDSREWQKLLLPHGCKGEELKTASKDVGCRLFSEHSVLIKKHKDADGILIAECCRRKFQ